MTRAPGLSADSDVGRCLLALRAGAMTAYELTERFGKNPAPALVRCGWVTTDGEVFALTEAGRAACPFRNPLAAAAAVSPKGTSYRAPPTVANLPVEETMVTRNEVLDQIRAAGALGITRKALTAFFDDVRPNVIDQHICALQKARSIFKPSKGLLVAAAFAFPSQHTHPSGVVAAPAAQAPVAANNSASVEAAATSSAADDAVATQPGEAGANPAPQAAPCRAGDAPAGRPERQPRPARAPAPSRAEDGRDISFAVWDDGVLCIHMEGTVIELPPDATARLARFIGHLEAA